MKEVAQLIAAIGGEAQITHTLAVAVLVAARVGPLTVLAPWLALRSAPAMVRAAIILVFTVAFTPIALETMTVTVIPQGTWALMFAREALVGLVFAFAVALPFFAFDWAGRVTDIWRGASLSEVMAPQTGERTSPMGQLYLFSAIVLFLTLGGHRYALIAFSESFSVAPIGVASLGASLGEATLGAARLVAAALAFAAAVAAPAAVCIVLVELGLGLIARAAPQVPVFFAGMPLRAATGIAAALIGLSVVIDQLPSVFRGGAESAKALVKLISS